MCHWYIYYEGIILEFQFDFSFSPESQHNSKLFNKVVTELQHEFGGQENCPWSPVVLKGAVHVVVLVFICRVN